MPTPQTDFQRALTFTLRFEGGFVDDPQDRGGRTNFGVTQETYDEYRRRLGASLRDVKDIARSEVEAIYVRYWTGCKADTLKWPLSMAVFDAAIHSGPNRATKLLQSALGVTSDGSHGPKTAAAAAAGSPKETAMRVCSYREAFLREIAKNPGQSKFLKGWLNRIRALRAIVEKG